MNNKIKYIIPAVLFAIVLATGCKKSAFDINRNPNSPTDSTIAYKTILPAALNNTAVVVGNSWGWLQNWMGYWARSGSFAPNATEESYAITTSFQTGIWSGLYDNAFDYQTVINGAKKDGGVFYEGIARTMKAHNFQILVDVYNNVPYFEALRGNQSPTPKYDNGFVVYQDLFRQLDTAQRLIASTNFSAGVHKNAKTDDIMFKGDTLKWRRFINTLKLRMIVHLSGYTPFNPAPEIARINAVPGGYLGAGESAEVNPGYTDDKPNPFYNSFIRNIAGNVTGNNNFFRANQYAIGYYGYNGDPRRARFYTAVSGAYVGVPYGAPPITANSTGNLSGIGVALGGSNKANQWILTSTESLFLQAEARQKLLIPGSASATLNNAIQESFTYTGAGSAAGYIGGNAGYPDVDYNTNSSQAGLGGGLYAIISQKWFALNGYAPFEVWTDWRRTKIRYGSDPLVGYTQGPPISISPSNNSTVIPRRLLYPQTEYNFNASNVGGQGAINQFSSKIFWDN